MDSDPSFELVQPSARRREFQLRQRDAVRAVLRLAACRSGARAAVGLERWRIERRGRFRHNYVVRDESSGQEFACVRGEGRRRVLELNGWIAEWKRVGRKEGFGFVASDGKPLASGKVRSGFLRSSGHVWISPALPEREAILAGLLAAYLLIRRNEEQAAAVAGASGGAT